MSSDVLVPTPKQEQFITAALSGLYRFLTYGGAVRGGKTVALLMLMFLLCKIYPRSRWALVRKDLPTLRRNTLPAFNKFRPVRFCDQVNKSDWIARCRNGSEIVFFPESAKIDPGYDRWAGLEVNGFGLEEQNELQSTTFDKCIERAGTWIIPGGRQPPELIWGTTNPDDGWVKRLFYEPFMAETLAAPYYFLPAVIDDNPYIPDSYRESLEELAETNPQAYARFVKGDWSAMEHPEQLISYQWCREALNVEGENGPWGLGVDVARSEAPGADDTVLAPRRGMVVHPLEYYHGLRTDQTAEKVRQYIQHERRPVSPEDVSIDTVGVGAGVWDTLASWGLRCGAFVAGASPVPQPDSMYGFKNKRSQAWWCFRELLRQGLVQFKKEDTRLFQELTAPRYRLTSDRVIEIESKDQIKKRIGRSTDAADAVIQTFAPVEQKVEIVFL